MQSLQHLEGWPMQLQVGELVDIQLRRAKVVAVVRDTAADAAPHSVVIDYTGDEATCKLVIDVTAPRVTVQRVAPAAWPPQPGDLWRSAPTQWHPNGLLWLACDNTDDDGVSDSYVPLRSQTGVYGAANDVLEIHGPMVLERRESTSTLASDREADG